MPGLEVHLLGPLTVSRDGQAIVVGGPKQRAVLAGLALEAGRVVSRQGLLEIVWGDPVPDRAEHTLHQHVSGLRKLLGRDDDQPLETRSPGYVLHAATDVAAFESAAGEGTRAAAAGHLAEAAEAFDRALGAWTGRALADADDSMRLAAAAVRLEERRLSVAESRNDAWLQLGRHREVATAVRELAGEHHHREHLWGQLMLALYRGGRQADALAAYGEARRALIDDLGIEPGQELRDLEQAILEQRPSLAGAATSSAGGADAATEDLFATYTADGRPDLGSLQLPDGQLVFLLEGRNVIGRDAAAVVRLVDNRVSRLHACVEAGPAGCTLQDLDSSNGTFVAGARISEHRLRDGEVISLGGFELRFQGPG